MGKVIGTVPGHSSWYRILYDGDTAEYTYDLLDDYRQGNLQVLGMLPKTLKSYCSWLICMVFADDYKCDYVYIINHVL